MLGIRTVCLKMEAKGWHQQAAGLHQERFVGQPYGASVSKGVTLKITCSFQSLKMAIYEVEKSRGDGEETC